MQAKLSPKGMLFLNFIYTFRYRYSVASRSFPKATNSVICAEFLMSSKLHFSEWKIYFSQLVYIDEFLKFKEIKYLIYYVKSEM